MIPGSETKKFIAGHLSGDTAALRLKYAGRMADAALDAALVQIDGRRRFGKKNWRGRWPPSTISIFPPCSPASSRLPISWPSTMPRS